MHVTSEKHLQSTCAMRALSTPPSRDGLVKQAAAESIEVLVRVRPLLPSEMGRNSRRAVTVHPDGKSISISASRSKMARCRYDHVLPESSTQEEVYSRVASCTEAAMNGFNATVLCYGQTATGKSFTMFGPAEGRRSPLGIVSRDSGIVPRSVGHIFSEVARGGRRPGAADGVHASFVQIYNDQVFDMFGDPGMSNPLEIREDGMSSRNGIGGVFIAGLSELRVRSADECLRLLDIGLENRSVRETGMNGASSRSHSIFQVSLERTVVDELGSERTVCGKLNLVDLAGSEKWNIRRDLNMMEDQVSELTNINSSLHVLGRCIAALASNAQRGAATIEHVPFRDSKLTRLLQDSLGGNAKTALIATLSPAHDCVEESISTLRFADRAHQVMTFAQANVKEQPIDGELLQRLTDEVARLKGILENHGIDYRKGKQRSGRHEWPEDLTGADAEAHHSDALSASDEKQAGRLLGASERTEHFEGREDRRGGAARADLRPGADPTRTDEKVQRTFSHAVALTQNERSDDHERNGFERDGFQMAAAGSIMPSPTNQNSKSIPPSCQVNHRLLHILKDIQELVGTFLELTAEEEGPGIETESVKTALLREVRGNFDSATKDSEMVSNEFSAQERSRRTTAEMRPCSRSSVHDKGKLTVNPEEKCKSYATRKSSLTRLLGNHRLLAGRVDQRTDSKMWAEAMDEEEKLRNDLRAAKARKKKKEKLHDWFATKENEMEALSASGSVYTEKGTPRRAQQIKNRREALEAKHAQLTREIAGLNV